MRETKKKKKGERVPLLTEPSNEALQMEICPSSTLISQANLRQSSHGVPLNNNR